MTLVWFRRAIRDLEAIRAYVAQDDPTAAQQLGLRLEQAVTLVRGQRVEILRVFHTARRWPAQL